MLAQVQPAAAVPPEPDLAECPLPLSPMDEALIAQTYPGRPMTTHHVLECARVPRVGSLLRAAEHLAAHVPALRAQTVEVQGRLVRTATAHDPSRARQAVLFGFRPEEVQDSGWVDRPFALDREWPFRVLVTPTPRGTWSIAFTLHHSVTDGRGALALFDAFLAAAIAEDARAPLPPFALASRHSISTWEVLAGHGRAFGRQLAKEIARSPLRFWSRRASLLDRPEAMPEGFGLKVVRVPREQWRALKARAERAGCTRNDLLWCDALRAADALLSTRGAPERSLRVVGGVDLRAFFGAEDSLSNWVGTLEADVTPAELRAPGLEQLVHARLREARAPHRALVTPVLLGMLGRALSASQFRALFRRSDAPGGSFPYTLLLSHIRPPEQQCWPEVLGPQALWCASTLPRKPGLGLTVTTVGEEVTIAACYPKPLVDPKTVDALLKRLLAP